MNYPTNLKESLIAAIPNCSVMVLGMMSLNLWIYGHLTWNNFWHALPLIYMAAFCLDFFIVGPLCFRIVNKLKNHKLTPFIRVGLMAGILTFVAPMLETGFAPTLRGYLFAFPRNYVCALVLQIFFALKLGMFVLGKYRLLTNHEIKKS